MLPRFLCVWILVMALALPGLAQEKVVELNQADLQSLCTLPGIGPKKAKAIIEYRQRRPFTRPTQLIRVKGIGQKTMKKLLTRIKVEPIYQSKMK